LQGERADEQEPSAAVKEQMIDDKQQFRRDQTMVDVLLPEPLPGIAVPEIGGPTIPVVGDGDGCPSFAGEIDGGKENPYGEDGGEGSEEPFESGQQGLFHCRCCKRDNPAFTLPHSPG
jgi:hypothetical protein